MKTAAKSYIDVTKETREKLVKAFNCTPQMVMKALTYRSDSELARKIRYTAVHEYGGEAWRHCPECETWYEVTEDGHQLMQQRYDNGAELTVDKQTGDAVLRDHRGNIVMAWARITFPKLTEIQLYAESL